MRVKQELGKLNGKMVFPTNHPMDKSGKSNVITSTVSFDDMTYIIPTMVEGKELSEDEAIDLALKNGLEKYPSYEDPTVAREVSVQMHDRVSSKGVFNLMAQ